MQKSFRTYTYYIARFFSLLMALHFLIVSVDVPTSKVESQNSRAIGPGEVENLLEILLEVGLEIYETSSSSEDYEKELGNEASADSFDLLHPHHQPFNLLHFYHSFLISLHKPCNKIQSRVQEINSPPPKRTLYSQRLASRTA